jgi:hypothetical protein
MIIKFNLVLVRMTILMFSIMPSVYAHTQDYLKGYKLGREDGKTGAGGSCFQPPVSSSFIKA